MITSLIVAMGVAQMSGMRVVAIGEPSDVFVSSKAGNKKGMPFVRIPGIASVGGGKLLAVCEGRQSGSDQSGNVLLVSLSSDKGKSWGAQKKIAGDGTDSVVSPTVVSVGSTVFIHYTVFPKGTDSYSLAKGYEGKAQRSYFLRSDDGGLTWANPVETTRMIRKEGVQSINFGPGNGLVLTRGDHKGRIVIPAYERVGGSAASVAVYSDDGGRTWTSGMKVEAPSGVYPNEVSMVERENGSLLFNARAAKNVGKRVQAVSGDAGEKWSDFKVIEELADPTCHAGLLRTRFSTSGQSGVILLSMPGAMGRRNGSVFLSVDDGTSWSKGFPVTKDYFGYSAMVNMGNGEVGLVYEAIKGSPSNPNTMIKFLRLKVIG